MAGPHVGSTIDLSEGGACIETSYTLKHGMGLEMTIAIRPRVISLRAEVVHILRREDKRLKTGIRFDSMAKDDRLFLAQCIFAIVEEQNRTFRS
jgi:c-di-GMP-binding flagellar brake protein YcgR